MSELLEKILDEENLQKALKAVKANKGASGVDGMKVNELEDYLKDHKEEILFKVRERKYKPLPVRRVGIPKGDGTLRPLGIPSVRDRWLQQAIYQVLSPICEEVFSESSFGFRINRRCEDAIIKALEYFNDGYDWIVDLDLSKFFDNVDQNILMILVHDIIKDGDTESIIRKFLQSGVNIGGIISPTDKGTPQGGNLSPLLANIYLNVFDKELEKRGLRFTRYADDCIICVKSKAAAHRVMTSVTRWLKEKLRVEVNATKTKVTRPEDTKYLGFSFYRKEDGIYRPKPHIRSIERLKEKLKKESVRSVSTSIAFKISKLNPIIRGWINYFRICDMKGWMKALDGMLRDRIRMCIWKQWKTPQKRRKSLLKLGASKRKAYEWSYTRKGPMAVASSWILHRTLRNEILKNAGLLSLSDYYCQVHNF